MKKNKLLLAICSGLLVTTLAACDGDDGSNGTAGAAGAPGVDGTNGTDGANAPTSLSTSLVGRVVLNAEDPEGAAEIVGYQKSKGWIYAINSSADPAVVEVIDINEMSASALTADSESVVANTNLTTAITISLADSAAANLSGDANSIAIDDNNELLAVAVADEETGVRGNISFYDISGDAPAFIKNVEVGYLPDNVVFTPDGSKAIVANEGEPNDDYTLDPEGSISVIDITDGMPANNATEITFTTFNTDQPALAAQGIKFSNPTGSTIKGEVRTYTVAQDLEPEYVAVSADSMTAFVSMQENNALAIVNLEDNSVQIKGLGFKDWSEYLIDVSDKDSGIELKNYQNLYGIYQPDTIASFTWNGADFVVTANEGDSREYIAFENEGVAEDANKTACETDYPDGIYDWDDGEEVCIAYTDEARVKDLEDFGTVSADLDAYVTAMGGNDGLGRLLVTNALGKNDADEYDTLYAYGARSFTIWDANGLVVFDSGDDMERITASVHGEAFNNNEDENEGDTRSDAKGPEPEALTIGEIGDRRYAFIGLERMGGIMAYDITNPYNVKFVDYFYNRGTVEGADITGDLAPEGMKFVSAEDSPSGMPLLIIGNEISGSVAVWQITAE